MAKRFTDSDKWKKTFFRNLESDYKLIWIYLLDECNHAGIWEVEDDVMLLRTKVSVTTKEIIKKFKDKIIVIDGGKKWFIPDFIVFQYGELNENIRAHNSVIGLLRKYEIKGFINPLQRGKDKNMDKNMDKDKEKFMPPTIEEVREYFNEKGYKEEAANKAFDYYSAHNWKDRDGKRVKNWKQKMIAVWFKDENKFEQGVKTKIKLL